MTAQAMLHDLWSKGVCVRSEFGDLKIKANRGLITEENKAKLVRYKSDLLAFFAAGNKTCGGMIQNDTGEGWRHSWCQAGCFDDWEASEGWLLTVFKPGASEGRTRVWNLLEDAGSRSRKPSNVKLLRGLMTKVYCQALLPTHFQLFQTAWRSSAETLSTNSTIFSIFLLNRELPFFR